MGESMITSFDGTKLYLKKETAADNKAVIVIVHGLCEHQGRYDYFAEKLHEVGIGTYRFDHRGHGRSEGEETFYSDFNELLDDTNVVVDMAIEENPDIPVFLLGHSKIDDGMYFDRCGNIIDGFVKRHKKTIYKRRVL